MKEFLVRLKNLSIITIITAFLIGIICVIRPAEVVQYVSIFFGALLILLGAGLFIGYLAKRNMGMFSAFLGIMLVIAGTVICLNYRSIVTAMLFIFGIFIICGGLIDFTVAIEAKRDGAKAWALSMVLAVITVIFGILIAVNPFDSVELIVRLLGISLLVFAVMEIITYIQARHFVKETKLDKLAQKIDDIPPGEIDIDAEEHKD